MTTLRNDAQRIIEAALSDARPDRAVASAIKDLPAVKGRLLLVAIGKAGWQMAKAAINQLGERISAGIVITKYGHSGGVLGHNIRIFEAGHPIPDAGSFAATDEAMNLVQTLSKDDLVLFLISGGGSALFEKPLCTPEELIDMTKQLLRCGADIVEVNALRKRLSAVKGGRFAQTCAPAQVFSVVLSDIVGDPLDMIASGPAYPDSSTCADALAVVKHYNLKLTDRTRKLLELETVKDLNNVSTVITGSVKLLCRSAEETARALGYTPVLLTTQMDCEAREAGRFLASIARTHQNTPQSLAFILGGETVVQVRGDGLGGRNQELALAASIGLEGLSDTALFSLGSDGTDGPTDAAGGYVDGTSASMMRDAGVAPLAALQNNDAYHALQHCDGLLMTGPTGTNVNDLTVLLIRR